MKTNIKPLQVNLDSIPDWQREKKWSHLQAWFMENTPKDEMRYKESAERQIMFVRDEFFNFFTDFMIDRVEVISTHTSKSISLPVYHIVLTNGMEFIMRGNFHDWKISISSPFDVELPEEILTNSTLSGEKINRCYCEGFDESWIWDSYLDNKRKFTLEIGASLYDLYTFLFLMSVQVNKQSKAVEAL
jgi:hypothetical protein